MKDFSIISLILIAGGFAWILLSGCHPALAGIQKYGAVLVAFGIGYLLTDPDWKAENP